MRTLLSLMALSLVGCASPATMNYVPPPIVDGCTIDVEVPVCAISRPRPYFAQGTSAVDLSVAYETVKGDLLRSEDCIEAMNVAISEWRQACTKQEVTRVRTR